MWLITVVQGRSYIMVNSVGLCTGDGVCLCVMNSVILCVSVIFCVVFSFIFVILNITVTGVNFTKKFPVTMYH